MSLFIAGEVGNMTFKVPSISNDFIYYILILRNTSVYLDEFEKSRADVGGKSKKLAGGKEWGT